MREHARARKWGNSLRSQNINMAPDDEEDVSFSAGLGATIPMAIMPTTIRRKPNTVALGTAFAEMGEHASIMFTMTDTKYEVSMYMYNFLLYNTIPS